MTLLVNGSLQSQCGDSLVEWYPPQTDVPSLESGATRIYSIVFFYSIVTPPQIHTYFPMLMLRAYCCCDSLLNNLRLGNLTCHQLPGCPKRYH